MELTVNGTRHTYTGDPAMPLLWYVRDELGLTGTKYGCGIGACGACTVHLDGVAVRGCQTPVSAAAGRAVTTIEGLAATTSGRPGPGEQLHVVQRAWRTHNVPQCGYCQAGQIMQAASLLARTPAPTDAEIDAAMRGNLCRCGTYTRIRAAIHTAAGDLAGAKPSAPSNGRS